MRFNLDNYIMKNEKGYFTDNEGGLFVEVNEDFIQPIGNANYKNEESLIEISRDEFIHLLLNKKENE